MLENQKIGLLHLYCYCKFCMYFPPLWWCFSFQPLVFHFIGGVFHFVSKGTFEEIGQGHMFSPVVPKGTFGKNFGTCFTIE